MRDHQKQTMSSSSSSGDSTTNGARLAATTFLLATAALFVKEKLMESTPMESSPHFSKGLSYSFVATLGNTAAAMLRKQLSATGVSSAEQVGLATLIQGFMALVFCQSQGLSLAAIVTDRSFVIPAVLSSTLNALTKTLETRAYATTDVSLCAPFLAFDPVFQFLVPTLVLPLICALLGCIAPEETFPAYHPAAVGCVAAGAFLLKQTASPARAKDLRRQRLFYGLPLGTWFILGNCVIYSVTSRLDKAAVLAAGSKTLYFTYSRVVMGSTAMASAKPSRRTLRKFFHPNVLVLLFSVCAAETLYLLSLYQAFAAISPVYVTAIKRGGGLLFSAVASSLFFSEPILHRAFPILAIVVGVVALCL